MNQTSRNKNVIKLPLLLLPILLFSACFSFSFSGSVNNVWKVPDTNLSIAVEKEKPSVTSKEVMRKMILRENLSDKKKIELAKGLETYSRINIYQIYKDQYVLEDVFKTYNLNTQTKTLTETSPNFRSVTYESTEFPKFIGAFDENENGNWRYLPASERKEIPLTTLKEN